MGNDAIWSRRWYFGEQPVGNHTLICVFMIDLVVVPKHVNAIFLSQGLYDLALEDCEKALQFNECNYKALFRKAKSLKEMVKKTEGR